MTRKTSTKTLYLLKTDGALINIKCTYYFKTDYIGIGIFKNPEQFKHKKIIPAFSIKKHTSVCSILKQHAENMKDDPERLTTDQLFDIMEDTINGKIKNTIPDSVSI